MDIGIRAYRELDRFLIRNWVGASIIWNGLPRRVDDLHRDCGIEDFDSRWVVEVGGRPVALAILYALRWDISSEHIQGVEQTDCGMRVFGPADGGGSEHRPERMPEHMATQVCAALKVHAFQQCAARHLFVDMEVGQFGQIRRWQAAGFERWCVSHFPDRSAQVMRARRTDGGQVPRQGVRHAGQWLLEVETVMRVRAQLLRWQGRLGRALGVYERQWDHGEVTS